ncbi:MAG: SDR family NAD(P)-dependent oxidoreductase [Acidobacteriota bacterium]|nr:SDR family NAD(P)-dependent oxidoreductase [Acidobacteriota bacterium]
MDDKAAIVTGAGEGIGLAIALALARAGSGIVLNDIDAGRAEAAAGSVRDQGADCVVVVGDVADPELGPSLVAAAQRHFGGVSRLAANAGVTLFRPFLQTTGEDLDRLLAVNLRGSFFVAQAISRHLSEQRSGGSIVFTSSVTGRRGHANLAAYAMTKAALEGLVRTLAIELAQHAIRVNAIVPGATLTSRNVAEDPSYAEVWAKRTPGARVGMPEDQAQAAMFLLSEAASHITGQALVVDGGWSVIGSTGETG